MNKIITVALIAGGLLLLDSPEAAAHKEVRTVYQPSAHYRVEHRRVRHMPRWLKRDRAFHRWYKRTHLRKYRRMSWNRLYEMYLWERVYASRHHRGDHHYRNDDYRNYDRRDHDRRGDDRYDDRGDRRRRKGH